MTTVLVVPNKGRKVDASRPVKVYRNLHRKDGKWYSVVQDGLVVGYAEYLPMRNVKFVVRPAGHRKALATSVRNVHAFVVGHLGACTLPGLRILRWMRQDVFRIDYKPSAGPHFMAAGTPIRGAFEFLATAHGCYALRPYR